MGTLKQRIIEDMESTEHELARQWIPVSERLPELGVEVLAHSASVGRQVAHTVPIQGGIAWHWGTSGVLGIDADHWMPMPEPPPETRAALCEQWERLHKGPRPETDVVITDDMRAWHEAARDMAKTKRPAQTVGDLLFSGKGKPPEVS
ncbi:MAG: hypothetical protein RLZZ21_1393 [Planctomycetota bacterium]|jgi:hypothetical protein